MTVARPAHNFDDVPTVTRLDEFWHRKYGEDEDGELRRSRRRPRSVAEQAATPTPTSTCRRRRTGRSSLALGLPSSATA